MHTPFPLHALSALTLSLAFTLPAAQAADVVIQPAAGSSLVVKDSAGTSDRLRVPESGPIAMPGLGSMPPQTTPMCVDPVLGLIGPCSASPVTPGFTLPYANVVNSPSTLFDATQSGTGGVLRAAITNGGNTAPTIATMNAGTGYGIDIQMTNAASTARGINLSHAGYGTAIYANATGGTAIHGETSSISAAGVIGANPRGEAVVGLAGGGPNKDCGNSCQGIGAVVGRHDGLQGIGVRGFVTHGNGGIGVLGQTGISGGSGNAARFENVNENSTKDVLVVASNGSGNLAVFSKGSNVARIDSTGKGFFNGGTQTGGADIAELINTTGHVPQPGDVVEIDPDNELHFRLSSMADSAMVAGVITTKPGVLMNAGIDDATGLPALALAGRVPVKVTLEGGPIRPGDLLVSASLAGHAKRAPGQIYPGTVIGKALQSHLQGHQGLVEMLVMSR